MAEDCHSSSKEKKTVPKIKGSHFYSRAKAKTPNTTSHFLYLAHKEMVDLLVLYHWWLYKIMHKTDKNVICNSKAPTFPKCPWKEKGFSQWEDRKKNHAYQRKACCQHAEQQCPKSRQTVVHTWGLTEWHLLQTLCQHLHSPTASACARTSDHLTKNTEEMGKTVWEANQHAKISYGWHHTARMTVKTVIWVLEPTTWIVHLITGSSVVVTL